MQHVLEFRRARLLELRTEVEVAERALKRRDGKLEEQKTALESVKLAVATAQKRQIDVMALAASIADALSFHRCTCT